MLWLVFKDGEIKNMQSEATFDHLCKNKIASINYSRHQKTNLF